MELKKEQTFELDEFTADEYPEEEFINPMDIVISSIDRVIYLRDRSNLLDNFDNKDDFDQGQEDEEENGTSKINSPELVDFNQRKSNSNQREKIQKTVSGIHPNELELYLGECADLPLLSREEEYILGTKVQNGLKAKKLIKQFEVGEIKLADEEHKNLQQVIKIGKESSDLFVKHNIKLVVKVAKRVGTRTKHLSLFDRAQYGQIGLLKAIEKFDPERGFKFSTYATWWIRQSITREISNTERPIRIPVHLEEAKSKLELLRRNFEREYGFEPSDEELAQEHNLSKEKIKTIKGLSQITNLVSLDSPIGDSSTTLGELRPFNQKMFKDPHDYAADIEMKDKVAKLINTSKLDKREKIVISLRYGMLLEDLIGEEIKNGESTVCYDDLIAEALASEKGVLVLQRLSDVFGVTRERVRQIEERVLNKLHKKIDRNGYY